MDFPAMTSLGGDLNIQCNGERGVELSRTLLTNIQGMVYINNTQECPDSALRVKAQKCPIGSFLLFINAVHSPILKYMYRSHALADQDCICLLTLVLTATGELFIFTFFCSCIFS